VLSRCRVTDQQPAMLQAVVVQTRENRRAGVAQFISPAVTLINGELVGHGSGRHRGGHSLEIDDFVFLFFGNFSPAVMCGLKS
jgi:hypothetical protein